MAYVSMADVASFYRFKDLIIDEDKVTLKNKDVTMVFEGRTEKADFNGVGFFQIGHGSFHKSPLVFPARPQAIKIDRVGGWSDFPRGRRAASKPHASSKSNGAHNGFS